MNYQETLDFLYGSLPVFQREGASAYKPGLENTAAFNALLGHPNRAFRAIHIAGTNGKGSVSHILASVLQAAGYRTGLFTSPHLKDFRERIRVDGRMIPEEEVVSFTEKYRGEMLSRGLTFFEMCTAMAFDHFARKKVDVAVIETGLGGRLDATNIITPVLSVITSIGLDHTDLLGHNLRQIAAEKAGIIKQGVGVVVGCRDLYTEQVFMDKASQMHSRLIFADSICTVMDVTELPDSQVMTIKSAATGDVFKLQTDLLGHYQRYNIPTVLAARRMLLPIFNLSEQAVLDGCRNVQASTGFRGRWQVLSRNPLTVCDTGHNAHGIREVVVQLARQSYRKLYIVIGVVADKDLSAILPLLPRDAYYFFTQPSTPRALDCTALAYAAAQHRLCGQAIPTVPDALRKARAAASPEDMIFIGGSNFTVADIPEL